MRRTLPSFISPPSAAALAQRGRRDWRGPAIIAALSLLLVVQIVLADRAALAASARWRPLVSTACSVLRCEVPAWREPGAMTLVDRDVRPHPARAGALRVKATFRNDARWAQAWPVLVLTLSDVDGRVVGARAFQPREYLGHEPEHATIGSQQAAQVAMDILEPMPGVVAFTFDFR
ncbi:DUF3426 domain-containing protein [Luteimonas sp. 8-5]|uniref:DUF3426 domain-containing protein n=1 Tax=Luteimonas sp. 8-5 TaxID=3039387 RepID=UPI002436B7B1|nr:DUF3426 domain-containing protein [Luteimonas sp. 8-5]MDG6348055.1 DUF3426 domain-containing protein [Luteimonas sp. 8-5]